MPINKNFTVDELLGITPDVARKYATVGKPTVARDLKELQGLNLIRKEGKSYIANTRILKSMMPDKKA